MEGNSPPPRRVTPSGTRHLGDLIGHPTGRSKWADFDRMVGCVHDLASPGQGCIEVVGVDDVETADLLFRLNERSVSRDQVATACADDGRCVGTVECPTEGERTAGV